MRGCYVCLLSLVASLAQAEPLPPGVDQAPVTTNAVQPAQADAIAESPAPEDARTEYEEGMAHLKAGRNDAGIFAFERALALNPQFHDARIAITRAFVANGEYVAARSQLDILERHGSQLSESQYAQASALHQQINDAMAQHRRSWQGAVGVALGHDSNVNAGTDITTVNLPQVGVLNLNASALSVDDNFAELQANVQYSQLTEAGHVLFAGGGVEHRSYTEEDDFNMLALRGFGGMMFEQGVDQYKFNLVVQQYSVDGTGTASSDQQQLGLQAQWKHRLDANRSLSGFAQIASIAYPDQPVRDVTQLLAGIGWEQTLAQKWKTFASAYVAMDMEATDNREDIGRNFAGMQLGLEMRPDMRNTGYAMLNLQSSRYGADDPAFQITRDDSLVHVVAGWTHRLTDHWHLQPEVRYTTNSSNIPVNEFDRSQLLLQARRLFK